MANLLEYHGGRPSNKDPKFVPLFMDRAFTGLFTQRAALHDPSDIGTLKYYGGRPDSLWMGSNIELTNRLTLQRRSGLSPFSTVTYPTAPDRAFSFELINGTIQVIIDTGSTGNLTLTSVLMSSGNQAYYIGSFPFGGSNAYEGMIFQVSGFMSIGNNGTFVCLGSTTTTLILENTHATPENDPAVAISSGAVYVDNQDGDKTLLFAKSPGAGQSYFVAVAGVLYIGDGVDTRKYTPLNPNGVLWNWGIVAPTNQPAVQIVPSGAAAVAWMASTVFSTMGLIYDTASKTIFQLSSVNASLVNTTRFGTSGPGIPAAGWNQSFFGLTPDNPPLVWRNYNQIVAWSPNLNVNNWETNGSVNRPLAIYDPITKALYVNISTSQNTNGAGFFTGSQVPAFKPGVGQTTPDNQCIWLFVGIPPTWNTNTVYPANFVNPSNPATGNFEQSTITEPNSLKYGLPSHPLYWQFVKTGGTSAATGVAPFFSQIPNGDSFVPAGNVIQDNGDLSWLSLGYGTWQQTTQYIAWTTSGAVFSAIVDPNGNFQVCTVGGTSASTQPSQWNTGYGNITTDGPNVVWTCVGQSTAWAGNTQWFLPTVGFSPPSSSSPYGGASVIDTNGDVEFVINSGLSQTPGPPAWNGIGQTTTDGTVTWYNLEVAPTQSLAWTQGLAYAYSYKARSLTDFYSVNVINTATPPVPPGLKNALPPPTGSETGAISTASPAFIIVGPDAGAVNTIGGNYSPDPQVDTIVIWRSADGGGSGQMFELTEIPNIPSLAGTGKYSITEASGAVVKVDWEFQDFLPDSPNGTYPGLNILIPAPINDSNDPPASTFLPMVYNFQRIWGAEGQQVNFSGGPDVLAGNPNEAFAPADEIPFLSNVIRLVKNTQGLVVFLTNSIQLIAGGPQTASFFSVELCPNVGLLSYNELDVHAGEIYFFSADNQFYAISPSLNLSRAGFPIADQLANLPSSGVSDTFWDSSKGYVATHQNGIDNGIFIADGVTGWYRVNPYQTPGGAQGPEPIWSPFATITNGCKMVQSIETAPGIKKLLVGTLAVSQSQSGEEITSGIINLRTAKTYGVLAGSTVANTGSTTITGDLGLNPGSSVTGSPTVTGNSNIDNPAAIQAKTDFMTAYNEAASLASTNLQATDLGGQTLTPGVYSSQSGAFSITSGNLTLDAGGNSNAVWVFQMSSTLMVANSQSVILANGAQANNVFWQVGGNVTIGTGVTFNGTIAAATSISIGSGSTVNGGVWAQNGSVVLDANTITSPSNLPGGGAPIVVPGPTTGYQILYRDLTKFTDNGIQYPAYYVMGSIMLVRPGELAVMKFLEMDFNGQSFRPTISFLLNEIAGQFTPFTSPPQADPPSIYGTTGVPGSYSPSRYYFSSTKSLARARHLQIRVDYGKTSVGDETMNMTIMGRIMSEF